jgi:class 3 adenylate cyclase
VLRARADRRVATALFIDVVDSTRVAADEGDARWRELVASFRSTVRRQLKRHGGHEVDTAGDGFFATFESPAGALRAAADIVADVQARGLDVRCGLHTGELERIDGRLGGIAAHIAARVMAEAGAAQVVTTGTVRDLVVGGAVEFEPVGEVELKGVPGTWMLHRVTAADGSPLPLALPAEEAAARRDAITRTSRRSGLVATLIGGVVVLALAGFGFAYAQMTRADGDRSSVGSPSPSAPPPVALMRLNPTTREFYPPVRDAALPPGGTDVQIVDGSLWSRMGDTLTRRDLQTGEVLGTIELPPETPKVVPALGSVWIAYPLEPDPTIVKRLDAISGRERATIEPGMVVWDFAVGDDAVYLMGDDSQLLEVDPATNQIVDVHETGLPPTYYVAYRDGVVWLPTDRSLVKFDPETDTIVDTIQGPQVGLGGSAIDPETGLMWVADRRHSTITPFNLETGEAEPPIGISGVPRGFTFGLDALWLASEEWVYRIDSWSRAVEKIPMPEGVTATGVGIDEETQTVWISTCAEECEDPI